MNNLELQKRANEVRKGIVTAVHSAKAGHPGGSLSAADVFTFLYFEEMNIDPANPDMEDRDRFVLSKGHTAPGLYSTLANRGFFPVEDLKTFRHLGAYLQGHPCIEIPGVDMSSGSLGQGTSVAAGLAYSIRMEQSSQKVYLIVGDGELNEGQCWEAFQFIAHNKLNEVIVIIDWNKKQLDGTLEQIMNPFSIAKKMEAFGFQVIECDGKDEEAISNAIDAAKEVKDSAVCIVMDTIKAQGVPYYYDRSDSHSPKFGGEADAALDAVIAELEAFIEKGEI